MITGGLISLRESLASLKPMERKVAAYILDHPHDVLNLSVQRLAELAQVSQATIVRLAQSLDLKGFQELKLKIAADLAQPSEAIDTYVEIHMEGSIQALIASVSHNNILSIQDTMSLLKIEQVGQAIDKLAHARKIAVFGVGASSVIAQDFKQKLTRINRWCEAAFDFDSQATIAANLVNEDVAFGISYSGETEDVIQSLAIAKQSGATIVSLTKFGSSPVSDLADIRLHTTSMEKSIRSGAMASRIAQLNVIDILYVGIARKNHEANIIALEKTRQAVKISKRYV